MAAHVPADPAVAGHVDAVRYGVPGLGDGPHAARDPARGHAARRHLQTLHRHQPLHLRSQVGYCQRPRHLITSLLKKQVFWWMDTTF